MVYYWNTFSDEFDCFCSSLGLVATNNKNKANESTDMKKFIFDVTFSCEKYASACFGVRDDVENYVFKNLQIRYELCYVINAALLLGFHSFTKGELFWYFTYLL